MTHKKTEFLDQQKMINNIKNLFFRSLLLVGLFFNYYVHAETIQYSCTRTAETWIVPRSMDITLDVSGAAGGSYGGTATTPGLGGRVLTTISVLEGEQYEIKGGCEG